MRYIAGCFYYFEFKHSQFHYFAMEITTSQNFYYTNKEPLSVEDVVDSLLALKSLIETAPKVLEQIIPGLNIYRVQIHVNEILSGSLIEDFVVKFF